MESDERSEKRGYHHGNLREALVEAALKLIAERGPQGFTFAEAARAAGVSPAAPYRHFKSREELIAEIARRGFILFAEQLEAAQQRFAASPIRAFEAVGRAYIDFARNRPAHYIAMFESGIPVASDPALNEAADRALGVLGRAAERLFAHLPKEKRPPVSMVAQHIWAMAHGVVELFARGGRARRSPFSAEDLLESGAAIYLRGLGALPDPD